MFQVYFNLNTNQLEISKEYGDISSTITLDLDKNTPSPKYLAERLEEFLNDSY